MKRFERFFRRGRGSLWHPLAVVAALIALLFAEPRHSHAATELDKLREDGSDLSQMDLFGNDLPGIGVPVYLDAFVTDAPSSSGVVANDPMQEIQSLMRSGNPQLAVEKAQDYVAQQPESLAGQQALANALTMVGRHAEAEAVLEAAITSLPNEESLYCHLGGVQLAAGRTEAARRSFKNAIAINGDSAGALLGLAFVAEGEGRFDDARHFFERCLETNPIAPLKVRLALAQLYNRGGVFDKSIELLQDHVTEETYDPLAHVVLGAAFMRSGRDEQAVDELALAWQLGQGNDSVLLWVARAFRELGRFGEATEALKGVSSDSALAAVLELAEITLASGEREKAVDLLEQAASSAQTPWLPKRQLALLALSDGNFEAAMTIAREIEAMDGVPLEEMDRLGAAFEARDRFHDALAIYEAARELYPNDAAPAYRLGVLHAAMGSFDSSIAELKRLLTVRPGHPAALKLLCIVLSEQGLWDEAAEAGKALLASRAQSVEDRLWVASIIERSGRVEDAMWAYRSVLDLESGNVVALNNLAVLLTGSGAAPEAINLATQAVERTRRENPDTLDTLGWALLAAERTEEALAALKEAVQLKPTDPAIRYHLALAHEQRGSIESALKELDAALSSASEFDARHEATQARERLVARRR